MSPASTLVICVDGWGAAWSGPYGNTWVDTPHLNRLASEGLVCDWLTVDTLDLGALYDRFWADPEGDGSLAATALNRNVSTALITDDDEVTEHPLADSFQRSVALDEAESDELVEDPSQTRMARVFASAMTTLEEIREPYLIWVHARGMRAAWDAPYSFREAMVEEGDPEPSDDAAPPERILPPHFDPDDVLLASQAYAGQVRVLDLCLGAVLDAVGSRPRQPRVIVTSTGGYPLGEHGRLGCCDDALYAERIHAPAIIRPPGGLRAPRRHTPLLQPSDLGVWLRRGESADAGSDHAPPGRDRVCIVGRGGETALRTWHWYARFPQQGEDELYVKPDDRFEANQIARRCPAVADAMREVLEASLQGDPPPLPAELTRRWE